jgi:hypothetical protein
LLPKVKGLKGPFSCLNKGLCLYLYGIWYIYILNMDDIFELKPA